MSYTEDEVYLFFFGCDYGTLQRAELFHEYRKVLTREGVMEKNILGRYAFAGERIVIRALGDDSVEMVYTCSPGRAMFISILEMTNCSRNSIYSAAELYDYYPRVRRTIARSERTKNKELYQCYDPFSSLSNSDLRQIGLLNPSADTTFSIFIKLLTVSLGRVPSASEVLGAGIVNTAKAEFTIVGKAIEANSVPEVVKTFVLQIREAKDALDDPAINARSKIFLSNIAEVLNSVSDVYKFVFSTRFVLLILRHLVAGGYTFLNYDDRVRGNIAITKYFSSQMELYFNHSVAFSEEDIIYNTAIRSYDELHSLNTYFSVISNKPGAFRSRDMEEVWAVNFNGFIAKEFMNVNARFCADFFEATCIVLLYFSIYGTSRVRVDKYRKDFHLKFLGRESIYDFSFVEKILNRFHSQGVKANLIRRYCRRFSLLTYRLRKINNVQFNIWNTFHDFPQYLCFDTVDCVPIKACSDDDAPFISLLSVFIKRNGRPVRGMTAR